MQLRKLEVRGYRCLADVTLDLDDLTMLLGSNSTGKSSLLRALRFFFEGERLSPDDVFDRDPDGEISVEVTFTGLTPADRAAFGRYAVGPQMVLRRTWRGGEMHITGDGLNFPQFDHVRALAGAAQRNAYRDLREASPELELIEVSTVEEARKAMLAWEMDHPEQCESVGENAGDFFGYASVAKTRLSDRFKFVLVPGLQDAADEAVERRGTTGDTAVVRGAPLYLPPDQGGGRIENGTTLQVTAVDTRADRLSVEWNDPQAGRRTAALDLAPLRQNLPGVRRPAIRLAYAQHPNPAQGATVERTATLGHPVADRKAVYVADTRAKHDHIVHLAREDLGLDGTDDDRLTRYAESVSGSASRDASLRYRRRGNERET